MSRECTNNSDHSNDAIVFVLEIVPADTGSFESFVLIRQEFVSWRISEWTDCEMKSFNDSNQDTGKIVAEKNHSPTMEIQESDADIEESLEYTEEVTQIEKSGVTVKWVANAEESIKDKSPNFASTCDSLQDSANTINNASNEPTSKAHLDPTDTSRSLSTEEMTDSLSTAKKKAISLLDIKIFTNHPINTSADPASAQQLEQKPSCRSNSDILFRESSRLPLSKLVACRVIEPLIFDVMVFDSNGKFSFLQHGHSVFHNSSQNILILAIKHNTIPNLSETAALFANNIIFIIQNSTFLSEVNVPPTDSCNDSKKWNRRKLQSSNDSASACNNNSSTAANRDKIQVSTLSCKRIQHIIINEISRYVAISKDDMERSIFALLIHS